MNIKDFFVPFVLALATWWGINYFFSGKKSADQYKFTAPQSAGECKPLNKEINFSDIKRSEKTELTQVETSWGILEFSTDGAILNRLEFKRIMNGDVRMLGTIFPSETAERENRAFIIGLNDETPFYYRFLNKKEEGDTVVVSYEASTHKGTITKTFIVYKDKHQMDLKIELDPRDALQARVFYPAPIMPELKEEDVIAADIIDGSDSFSKTVRSSIKADDGWIKPELFGLEDKYFIHSMVKDPEGFAERAYFKLNGKKNMTAILEGPTVLKDQSWLLSFYLGPKEEGAIERVDGRLEQALDYSGIWSFISRFLLKILNWLYDYFHNYGVAIIILTFLIRLLLLPFSFHAEKGMKSRTEMQKKMQYIAQKYKDNPEAKMQAQTELVRQNGLGLGSCLPMLIQLPIFLGLSRVLSSSILLYKSPFLWIPSLSSPDPFYILPLALFAGMMITAFTTPGDLKQRLPLIVMGFAFGAASTGFASGLVLYIVVSVLLNALQTKALRFFGWA